jgi:hypothetical protein
MKLLAVIFLVFVSVQCSAQDTLLFINGKILTVKNAEVRADRIHYETQKNKEKNISLYRVFSIKSASGDERVVYERDTLDANDFTIEDMRMFIRGEQEADLYYHNTPNKVISSVVGAASGMLTIYGLVVPPLYATFVAGITPDIDKHEVSDPALKQLLPFREGYESKARRNKIRNSLIYGFGGFVVGFAAYSVFLR